MNNTPHLTKRDEFEALLRDYRMSSGAKDTLAKTPFAILLAATASGRNTIIDELVKTDSYYFMVSDTTRPPRVNNGVPEQDGREYFFCTEDEVLQGLRDGRYIEAEIIHNQQVSGTNIKELEKALAEDKIAITEVDIEGSLNISRLKPDAFAIFIVPPSFDEWLRRIASRNDPTQDEIKRRMQTAVKIFDTVLHNDRYICVVNDKLPKAVRDVDVIVRQHQQPTNQNEVRQLISQLQQKTIKYLELN